ncbi:hypothetical protein [Terracidiphilus gabretensis]|uniref:hypothetical protein n=1 Tax=Terracidiphilus gabretensis TaxID=1577687 RepID=UPI00071B9B0F|nr:hypothetical protein [Terracidiphilus gabretensis]
MLSPSSTDTRIAEIAKIAETKGGLASLQQHLKEVIEGDVFKGSHRSGQFLQYIVDQAVAGHFDSLKERVIGMELFGRSASYDTGDDAIVRVTASDVRKRLLQHYGRYGATSMFRISLPAGSYIPEILCDSLGEVSLPEVVVNPQDPGPPLQESALAVVDKPVVNPSAFPQLETAQPKLAAWRLPLLFGIFLVALNLALWGIFWSRSLHPEAARISSLPWSALFGSSHSVELITSDPNIAEIQGITGSPVSVSDYANRNYIPVPNKLTPAQEYFCKTILRGDNSAGVDAPIVAKVAALAQTNSKSIAVRAARSIQLIDLKSDSNFIFLGSPRSDPWVSLFNDQLDFRFELAKNARSEFIRNVRPRPSEQPQYIPTAPGWGTGDSYAIIALVKNPDQSGQVLLLAGANAEGTEAAGKLVTDFPRLSTELSKCGISSTGPVRHFEMLLHLNTMAGTPNNVDLVACHILPDGSAR